MQEADNVIVEHTDALLRIVDENEELRSKGWFGSENLRALWGLFILNTGFASAQIMAAKLANSLSLFSDSSSMLVDSLAYLINLCMEKRKHQYGAKESKLAEIYVSVISVSLLSAVTVFSVVDAALRIKTADSSSDETVDGRIVLGFSIGNLFIDFLMCTNYCYQLRSRKQPTMEQQISSEKKEQLNMVSAFVHVFADTLRTITGITAGVLEEKLESDAVSIDAIATFMVSAAILLSASFVLFEAVVQFREYRKLSTEDVTSSLL
jgi:Co/Zn/Cd efflux system component